MPDKLSTMFVKFPDGHNIPENGPEWHFQAWALWNNLSTKVTLEGIGWLLGRSKQTVNALRKRNGWPRRLEMRKASQEAAQKEEKKAPAPLMRLDSRARDIYFSSTIPRVSLIKLVRYLEYQAEQAAIDGSPSVMTAWLSNLAGVDAAIRARKSRIIDRIAKDSIKIYLPREDARPQIDVEDAQVIPEPVEF